MAMYTRNCSKCGKVIWLDQPTEALLIVCGGCGNSLAAAGVIYDMKGARVEPRDPKELEEEIALDNKLLEDRARLLDLLPCPVHGRCVPHAMSEVARLREKADAWKGEEPIDKILFCPQCGKQHLDIGEFRTRRHRTHLCENTPDGPKTGCGHLWVPHAYATRGVTVREAINRAEERVAELDALRNSGEAR